MDPYNAPPSGSLPPGGKPPPTWLVRLVSGLVVIAVLVVAIFLGGIILVTGAVLGVALWGWLWWQRRKMMKRMDAEGVDSVEVHQAFRSGGSDERIIEGDFKVIEERDEQDGPRSR